MLQHRALVVLALLQTRLHVDAAKKSSQKKRRSREYLVGGATREDGGLPPDEMCEKIFEMVDDDYDGMISQDESVHAPKSSDFASMFSWMDSDNDLEVTRDECVAHLLMRAKARVGEDVTDDLARGKKSMGGFGGMRGMGGFGGMGGGADMGGIDPSVQAKIMSMMGGGDGTGGGMSGGFQSMAELEAADPRWKGAAEAVSKRLAEMEGGHDEV